ncbi:MAG: hypothetical protein HC892_09600 [Saprospiraceae bacterium]|nr:hypothetical protein [Saprospiraceae bacterium]
MSTVVTDYQTFVNLAEQSAYQNTLIKITLSKPRQVSDLKKRFYPTN